MRYRPDIDGLRALAIVPVVLFHAGIAPFGGGYVGVDVFFVISGYLITSLIVSDLQHGRFTLLRFYERRVRRIFPALFLVLAASFVAAFLLFLPEAFDSFSKALVAATAFLSNVLFDRWTGYFAVPAERNPLLHTWSLAIEEQFYVLFPLILLAALRFAKGRFLPVIVPLLALSLAFSIGSELLRPRQAFFLLPARGWELMLGAALAQERVRGPSHPFLVDAMALAGLAMIGAAVFAFDKVTPHPGFHALLPCLGTALVIWSGKDGQGIIARHLLAAGAVVFVGLISYSLYLWHWPLLAVARYAKQAALAPIETAGLLALAVAAAVLSWRFVERPFRGKTGILNRRQIFACAGAAMAAAIVLGGIGIATEGWPSRLPGYEEDFHIAGRETYNEGTCFLRDDQNFPDWRGDECRLTQAGRPVVMLWGDSLAAHYAPGLTGNAALTGYDTLQYTKSGCLPLVETGEGERTGCEAFNHNAARVIDAYEVRAVILSGRWWAAPHQLPRLAETVAWLLRRGLRVLVVGQGPVFPFDRTYDYFYLTGGSEAEIVFGPALNEVIRQASAGAAFFDPTAALCSGARCPFKDATDFLFWDASHLSMHGSDVQVRKLAPLLK